MTTAPRDVPVYPQKRTFRSSFNGVAQGSAKLSVTLDVPLATHGFVACLATFGIEQSPFPPSSRLSTKSRIVLLETSLDISRPADIGTAVILAAASQYVNEKEYFVFWARFNQNGFLHGSFGLSRILAMLRSRGERIFLVRNWSGLARRSGRQSNFPPAIRADISRGRQRHFT